MWQWQMSLLKIMYVGVESEKTDLASFLCIVSPIQVLTMSSDLIWFDLFCIHGSLYMI
jgi:hypothetical protein